MKRNSFIASFTGLGLNLVHVAVYRSAYLTIVSMMMVVSLLLLDRDSSALIVIVELYTD